MNKKLFMSATLLVAMAQIAFATATGQAPLNRAKNDSLRIAELDAYWEQLNNAVIEGDFESYKTLFHKDAVVIFANGKHKKSMPISTALDGWKAGFKNTKEGKTKLNIEMRFSQRIGNETTAHETGIFVFTATDSRSNTSRSSFIPFEMLLIKRNNKWYALMEYQKPYVTQKEWDALE